MNTIDPDTQQLERLTEFSVVTTTVQAPLNTWTTLWTREIVGSLLL